MQKEKFEEITEFIKKELKEFKLIEYDLKTFNLRLRKTIKPNEIDLTFSIYFGNNNYFKATSWFFLYNNNADCLFSSITRFESLEEFKNYIKSIKK